MYGDDFFDAVTDEMYAVDQRFHLVLDVPVSREFKAGVNVLDSVDAIDEREAREKFDKRGWGKPGAYVLSDDEAYRDPRGIFH